MAANEGWAQSASEQKEEVDAKLRRAESRLARARAREEVLTSQVQAFNADIRELEARLRPLRARAEAAEARAARLEARLAALTERLEIEKRRLARAEDTLVKRRVLLAERLRDVYVRGEPDPILVLIESDSVTSAVDTVSALQRVVESDRRLVGSVESYRDESERTKQAIAHVRADVAVAEKEAEEAARKARAAAADLESQHSVKETLRAGRRQLLAQARGDREHIEEEARDLERRSGELAAKIVAAQSTQQATQVASGATAPASAPSTGPPSSSGLVWPVNGTITSGYGPRWGKMHEGIDIAGASGTPIGAAAAGTVILAGWQGGYGQLVVVDHGGGLSTAYAHLSSIGVTVGQQVAQGQSVGGMGTTGNSTGVHLHFEVRVNGAAVNPLGYL